MVYRLPVDASLRWVALVDEQLPIAIRGRHGDPAVLISRRTDGRELSSERDETERHEPDRRPLDDVAGLLAGFWWFIYVAPEFLHIGVKAHGDRTAHPYDPVVAERRFRDGLAVVQPFEFLRGRSVCHGGRSRVESARLGERDHLGAEDKARCAVRLVLGHKGDVDVGREETTVARECGEGDVGAAVRPRNAEDVDGQRRLVVAVGVAVDVVVGVSVECHRGLGYLLTSLL